MSKPVTTREGPPGSPDAIASRSSEAFIDFVGVDQPKIKQLMRSRPGRGKSTPAKLQGIQISSASGANSTLAVMSAELFSSTNFPELAAWTLVYDECRIRKVTMHYRTSASVSATGVGTSFFSAVGVGFDPTASVPSSVGAVRELEHCSQYINTTPLVPLAEIGQPFASRVIASKIPVLLPMTATDCPGSGWFTLDSSSALTACCVHAYVPNLGTAGVSTFTYILELDVEFRSRI